MKSRRNLQRLRFPQVVSYGGQQGAVLQTVSEGVVGSVAAGSAAAAVAVGAAVVGWLVASAKCQQAVAGTLAVGATVVGMLGGAVGEWQATVNWQEGEETG